MSELTDKLKTDIEDLKSKKLFEEKKNPQKSLRDELVLNPEYERTKRLVGMTNVTLRSVTLNNNPQYVNLHTIDGFANRIRTHDDTYLHLDVEFDIPLDVHHKIDEKAFREAFIELHDKLLSYLKAESGFPYR